MTAARVLPAAIPSDVEIELAKAMLATSVVAFAVNTAANIAGQTRTPRKRMTAKAKPVGGQMGTALAIDGRQ